MKRYINIGVQLSYQASIPPPASWAGLASCKGRTRKAGPDHFTDP